MFSHEFTLMLRHTDAAGVAFFASYFSMAHDAYELALEDTGEPLAAWLSEVPMPLVSSEATYHAPIRHGERVRVDVGVESVGSRSFTLRYLFWVCPRSQKRWGQDDSVASAQEEPSPVTEWKVACKVKTVHVAIDPKSSSAVKLPNELLRALERLGPIEPEDC